MRRHFEGLEAVIYRLLQQRAAELTAGPEAAAAGNAARDRQAARQKALAFKRAREGRGRGGGRRG